MIALCTERYTKNIKKIYNIEIHFMIVICTTHNIRRKKYMDIENRWIFEKN